jgi:tetratricopeptide (TPR) repeat protein
MTKLLGACLLVLSTAASLSAATTLKEARLRWLKGNYEEAQSAYEDLAKKARTRSPATIGLSRTLQSQGEYDKALAVVEKALKALPKDADLLARKAEVLYLRGRWAEAEKAANAAIARNSRHFGARWVRAQVIRDRGDLKKADGEFRWFVRNYDPDKVYGSETLVLVGLAACEFARINALSEEFQTVLDDLYDGALKVEPAFWPAEYQAGMLLLEKYKRGDALDALDKALTLNPSCSEALAGKGLDALMRFEFKEAQRFAEQALKFNPRLPEALRLLGDVHLASGDPASALRELVRARQVNPRDERTLARIAACYQLQGKKLALAALIRDVEKHDTSPALFYSELGERLEERRRYNEAERYYRKALELRKTLASALNNLGMLYMRLGREKEAAPLLEKGFAADDLNVRVKNMLRVLRHLKNYKTIETDHFHLRYNPAGGDEPLAKYMALYLEEIYEDLARKFAYRPKGPILIELFSSHDKFSGRVIALPDLHTIGACTGRMVALASPHASGVRQPFNWARVLRHEIVHIFNLEQTNFLVPHWLTEGLAVSNEGFPRPPIWNQLLAARVPARKLLDLDTIDLGFIRPRNALQWQQAYCQAQLYVEYIQKEYGRAGIGKLLAAYADGLGTSAALARACKKVSKAEFEKGYRAYLDEVVKPLRGKKQAKSRTLKQLLAEYKKDMTNADVAAELAFRFLPRSRKDARRFAEQACSRKRDHPRACYVLARLANAAGDENDEKRLLKKGLDPRDPDPLILKALGKIYYDGSEFKEAAKVFEMGRKAEPHERGWLLELARVYAQTNDKAKQIAVLKDLVPTDADDFDRRVRLARLLLEKDEPAEAERYARQALEIDIRSKEARGFLFKALAKQNKDKEAERLRAILEPKK